MTNEQIKEFTFRLKLKNIEKQDKLNAQIEFKKIAKELCDPKCLTRIFISDVYSNDMPGYITIPYNYEFKEFVKYYNENKEEINRKKRAVNINLIYILVFGNKQINR